MSVQLKPDEALELLELAEPETAKRFEVMLCTLTSQLGAELARIHDCEAGVATHQPGFGGICVPINPKHGGQPLPDGWRDFEFMQGEVEEWEEEAKRLEEPEGGPKLGETEAAANLEPEAGYKIAEAGDEDELLDDLLSVVGVDALRHELNTTRDGVTAVLYKVDLSLPEQARAIEEIWATTNSVVDGNANYTLVYRLRK